jgi:hypothetical protein
MSDEAMRTLRDRVSEKSREELLAEIADLPPSAFIPTAHAAAYLGSTPGVMLNWRSQRKGPRYHGRGNFIRYRISDLDLWMASRADEVRLDDPCVGNIEPNGRDQATASPPVPSSSAEQPATR